MRSAPSALRSVPGFIKPPGGRTNLTNELLTDIVDTIVAEAVAGSWLGAIMEQEHQHQHQPPAAGDDVVVQLSASAVAAVDERSSTATGNEDDDDDANAAGKSRRTFSQSYKMAHRKPQVRN